MNVVSKNNNNLKPCVYIVEDDEAVRDSLRLLLKSEGYQVKAYVDGDAFLVSYNDSMSGCLVLDIRMPGIDGMNVQRALAERGSILPILFVTGHGDVSLAVEAMKKGAMDFIQKPYEDDTLLKKVADAMSLDFNQRSMLNEHALIQDKLNTLTPREKEVLDMMISGNANKVIAIDLNISQRTVEIHRSRVMHKMGTSSLAHLVKMIISVNA